MPTNKPRIAVTLQPYVYETVSRLAKLQGRSRGSVVAELLEAVNPPLMRTVALLEAAAEAPGQVSAGLVRVLEDMERELVAATGAQVAQLDWLAGKVGADMASGVDARSAPAPTPARAKKRSSKRGPKAKPNPRVVTRGSGTKNQRVTKPGKGVR